jgi:hypothetical protein
LTDKERSICLSVSQLQFVDSCRREDRERPADRISPDGWNTDRSKSARLNSSRADASCSNQSCRGSRSTRASKNATRTMRGKIMTRDAASEMRPRMAASLLRQRGSPSPSSSGRGADTVLLSLIQPIAVPHQFASYRCVCLRRAGTLGHEDDAEGKPRVGAAIGSHPIQSTQPSQAKQHRSKPSTMLGLCMFRPRTEISKCYADRPSFDRSAPPQGVVWTGAPTEYSPEWSVLTS